MSHRETALSGVSEAMARVLALEPDLVLIVGIKVLNEVQGTRCLVAALATTETGKRVSDHIAGQGGEKLGQEMVDKVGEVMQWEGEPITQTSTHVRRIDPAAFDENGSNQPGSNNDGP